jgi:hypothetical protein
MNSDIFELDRKVLDDIRSEHPNFHKKLSLVENNFLKVNKHFPLDYV